MNPVLLRKDYDNSVALIVPIPPGITDLNSSNAPTYPTHIDGKPVSLAWVPAGSRII